MTRSRAVLVCTLLGTTLIAVSAWILPGGTAEGQEPKAANGQANAAPDAAGLDLLRIEQVRNDLRIGEEQEQKLMSLGDDEGDPKNLRKKALEILTLKQRERLKQIRLQSMGPVALADPTVIKALDLNPEQRKMVKALPAQLRQAIREAIPRDQKSTAMERSEKRAEVQEKIWKTALEALTPAQREKFEKMKGEKLDIDFSELWP